MDEKETGRLEAFSDGVFAVAITLLILNIKIPGFGDTSVPTDGALLDALRQEWTMLAAYIVSFGTIGVMWLNHHKMFKYIKRIDNTLILLNLLLLAVIVFVPVPTALFPKYLLTPEPALHVATLLYGGTFFLAACCFNFLWRYALSKNRLSGNNVDLHAVDHINRQYNIGLLAYFVVFVLAFFSTLACAILSFLLVLFFALPEARPHSHKSAEQASIVENQASEEVS